MSIQLKNDYSYLFSGFNSRGGSGAVNNNLLSEYASIKNGSYFKLMKAYYGKNSANVEDVVSPNVSTSKDSAKTLASISENADKLQASADALVDRGSKSLFKKEEITTTDENGAETTRVDYNKDSIYKGVKAFVDDYNRLISSASDSSSSTIERQTKSLVNATKSYSKMLENVGISIGTDNKLTIDETKFKDADMNKVKSLFNGTGSYAYTVQSKAAMVDYNAEREAQKANTYNAFGGYNNPNNYGSIYNSFF